MSRCDGTPCVRRPTDTPRPLLHPLLHHPRTCHMMTQWKLWIRLLSPVLSRPMRDTLWMSLRSPCPFPGHPNPPFLLLRLPPDSYLMVPPLLPTPLPHRLPFPRPRLQVSHPGMFGCPMIPVVTIHLLLRLSLPSLPHPRIPSIRSSPSYSRRLQRFQHL